MSRNRQSPGRRSRRIALTGALFTGLASAGCFFIGDSDARDEAEDARESFEEAMEEFTEAAEEVAEAATDMVEDLADGRSVENPVDFREFYDVLPDRVGDFRRTSREGNTAGAFGFKVSAVEAEYEAGNGAEVDITVVDAGALGSIGSKAMAAWLDAEVEAESDGGWARTLEYGGHPAFEEFERRRDNRGRGTFAWFVEGRFVVALDGRDVTVDELYELRDAIDVDALAELPDREGN
ncbi:hypothetical protein [Candidatus Palauibacter sp.]|uniref:hypothetical protein n=1 Tax=Candidatus Palauibacter sp. TaxID=3101350 RepID=UPI003AF30138